MTECQKEGEFVDACAVAFAAAWETELVVPGTTMLIVRTFVAGTWVAMLIVTSLVLLMSRDKIIPSGQGCKGDLNLCLAMIGCKGLLPLKIEGSFLTRREGVLSCTFL